MKRIFFFSCLLWLSEISAQNVADAVRYSFLEAGGTARTVGVGGALGAFGTDFSVLSTNPAGLAAFRRSELVLTPAFFVKNTESVLQNEGDGVSEKNKNQFHIQSLGAVFYTRLKRSRWKAFNVGIGINRLANLHGEFSFSGNTSGSYADRFVDVANGIEPNNLDAFEGGPAFDAGAIYNIDPNFNTNYTNDFQGNPIVPKGQSVKRSGSINELAFSFAGNFDHKFMIGATIGLPFVNFDEEKNYYETDENGNIPYFNSMDFREELSTSGVGINFKLGLIYRISQAIRLGASIHTPTAFSLTDNFNTSLVYNYTDNDNDGPIRADSPAGTFDYKFVAPWRTIGSFGVLIKKKGFLSAEIEYVNYASADFDLTTNSTNAADAAYEEVLNEEIAQELQSALNFRLGGEYAHKKFRFRAGFGINGTPYADKITDDNIYLSTGLGFREKDYYIDLAYKRSTREEVYSPYSVASMNQQLTDNSFSDNLVMVTLGFRLN